MAKDIPRATLRQLVREYKANGLFRPSRNGVVAYADSLLIYNATNSTIPVGGAIKVSGFPASISYEDAIERLINGELVLNGVATSASDDSGAVATAREPIPSGAIGRVKADAVFARVHYNAPSSGESEYDEASSTFELVKTGTFKTLASSRRNAGNYMICALARKGGDDWSSNFTVNYATVLNNVEITLTQYDEPPGVSVITAVSDVDVSAGSLVFVLKYWKVSPKTVSHTINVVKSIQRNSSGSGS